MDKQLAREMWPVMITPFDGDGQIDYPALEKLIAWYEARGTNGLFAVCQSSEMFYLSLRERAELVTFIKRHSRLPIIASGHVSYALTEQIDELKHMQDAGADSLILITNRLDHSPTPSARLLDMTGELLHALDPSISLGFYECPYPFKRLLTTQELEALAPTGRFHFLKDTCCDITLIRERLDALRGSELRLFNANTSTLLSSLRAGAAGFSGVMSNFHPELYAWLLANWQQEPEKAEGVQAFLTAFSFIERQMYPVNAKYHLAEIEQLLGSVYTRSVSADALPPLYADEVRQMHQAAQHIYQTICKE